MQDASLKMQFKNATCVAKMQFENAIFIAKMQLENATCVARMQFQKCNMRCKKITSEMQHALQKCNSRP